MIFLMIDYLIECQKWYFEVSDCPEGVGRQRRVGPPALLLVPGL